MPKVSVIVPVYGVEKYIERCACSLFEQTLDDIEFIFVDDCTPDRSIEILTSVLEDYPKRKKQTKIIHHDENKGLPKARQTGINVSTGDYIAHCDSDDWVQRDIYQKMYDNAVRKNADVVVCDYSITDGRSYSMKVTSCHATAPMSFIKNCLCQKDSWALWNKLFKRDVYSNNIESPTGAMGEDMVTVIQLMVNCKILSYLPESLYNYFYNQNSITKTSSKEAVVRKYEQLASNANIVIRYLTDNGISTTMNQEMIVYKNFIRSILYPIVWDKKYYTIWNTIFPKLNRQVLVAPGVSICDKIKIVLTVLHLYPRRRNRAK